MFSDEIGWICFRERRDALTSKFPCPLEVPPSVFLSAPAKQADFVNRTLSGGQGLIFPAANSIPHTVRPAVRYSPKQPASVYRFAVTKKTIP